MSLQVDAPIRTTQRIANTDTKFGPRSEQEPDSAYIVVRRLPR